VGGHAALNGLLNEDLVRTGVLPEGEELQVLKSAQWSALSRMHAQLVALDEHLWPLFSKWCRFKVCDCSACTAVLNLSLTCMALESCPECSGHS
jgi:hypothetical protein